MKISFISTLEDYMSYINPYLFLYTFYINYDIVSKFHENYLFKSLVFQSIPGSNCLRIYFLQLDYLCIFYIYYCQFKYNILHYNLVRTFYTQGLQIVPEDMFSSTNSCVNRNVLDIQLYPNTLR